MGTGTRQVVKHEKEGRGKLTYSELNRETKFLFDIGILALTLVFAFLALANLREPWSDEAMLAYNFVVGDVSAFEPLPYYEQAVPSAYAAIVSVTTENAAPMIVSDRMRVISLIAFCLGLIVIASAFRERSDWIALFILFAIVFASPVLWQYSVEIKHYSFEFCTTALVIVAGQRYSLSGTASAAAGFLFVAMIAPFFSFTAPLVISGTATTIVLFQITELWQKRRVAFSDSQGAIWSLLAVNAGAVFSAAAVHLLLNRALVHYQMTAYSDVYEAGLADISGSVVETVKILSSLPEYLLFPLGQGTVRTLLITHFNDGFTLYASIALGSFAVLAALVALAVRRAPFFAALIAIISVFAIGLNIAGLLPFQHPRHFIFLAPLALVLASFAGQRLYNALEYALERRIGSSARGWLAPLGVFALVVPATLGSHGAVKARSAELLPVLDYIQESSFVAPVWIYPSVQPMARMVVPEGLQVVGYLDNRSREKSWVSRSDGETPDLSGVSGPVWLVFPIVPSLDYDSSIGAWENSKRTCTEQLATNGTRLFLCQ